MKTGIGVLCALLFSCLSNVSFSQSLYNRLLAYYPFDSKYSPKDRMTGDYATLHGITSVPDRLGRQDSAFHFNGKTWDSSFSDTIIIHNNGRFVLREDSTFSISFWIDKFTETTEMIKWGNFSMYQFANGFVDFPERFGPMFYCTGYEAAWDWDINGKGWDHYVLTYDKGLWGIYINGDSVTEVFENYPLILENSESDIYLGINASNSIDDFYFFNKKLSKEEVLVIRDEDIFDLTPYSLVLQMEFNGNLQDDICQCSPRDSSGSLVEDRFGNPQSAFLTSSDFEPLVFPYRSDFDLSYDSSLSVSLWFKAKKTDVCPTDVLIGQGEFRQGGCFGIEFAAIFPCMNYSVDIGKMDHCIDSYGEGMTTGYDSKGGIAYQYPEDIWNHLVFTYDGTMWKMYLNNELVNSVDAIDRKYGEYDYAQQYEVVIGASYDSVYLDDIYYFKKVLTTSEIHELYNAGGIITAVEHTSKILEEHLSELQIYDFSGRLMYSEKYPGEERILNLTKKHTGIFRYIYDTRVEVVRHMNF